MAEVDSVWRIRCGATRRVFRLGLFALVALAVGCEVAPRELADLTVVDSVYIDPESGAPWSGPVVRYFEDDPELVQVEGTLLDGTWHDDFVVYHVNGRIRYMGSFNRGDRCGAWTENADSTELGSVYEALLREVETMGMYPPCEGEDRE
ncbi:MAG: hypothetical protein AAF389_20145 [Gemmatimonadota bacterium]